MFVFTHMLVIYLYLPITWTLNWFFHGTPMLNFCMELKYVWMGRTMVNPDELLFINIGMETT